MEPLFQFADDIAEARNRALFRLQHIDPLDCIPKPALFLEVQPVTLLIALDQHTEEAEEKLHILFGGSEREWIDREVARVLADIQVRSAEDRRERLEAAADIEDVGLWRVLLCVLQQEVAEVAFA